MNKIISVFASGFPLQDKRYFEFAFELGRSLAINNYIVATGGGQSLMNEVLKGAKSANGYTIGICLDYAENIHSDFIDEKYVYDNLQDRQNHLIRIADSFIAIPGGVGTLYEIFNVLTLIRIGKISKKIIVSGEIYSPLRELLDDMLDQGFIGNLNFLSYSNNLQEIIDILR